MSDRYTIGSQGTTTADGGIDVVLYAEHEREVSELRRHIWDAECRAAEYAARLRDPCGAGNHAFSLGIGGCRRCGYRWSVDT